MGTAEPQSRRPKPCQHCKLLRRKCERQSLDEACARCVASKRPCTNDDVDDDRELDAVDGSEEIQYYLRQVQKLERSMSDLAADMQRQQGHAPSKTPIVWREDAMDADSISSPALSWTSASVSSFSLQDEATGQHQVALARQFGSSSLSPSSSSGSPRVTSWMTPDGAATLQLFDPVDKDKSQNDKDTRNSSDFTWNLTLTDGRLKLNSTIQSIDELREYDKAFHRFLSPFSALFEDTAFVFERFDNMSLLPRTIEILSKTKLKTKALTLYDVPSTVPLAHPDLINGLRNGTPPPIEVIDLIIQSYMQCVNEPMPLLHAPTYLKRYHDIIRLDPYTDTITMAICCAHCASTCSHLPFPNYDRRVLADFFYERATSLIYDIFDDPDHRLETLMAVNLLTEYRRMSLRISEATKWIDIAVRLANDLAPMYDVKPAHLTKPDIYVSQFKRDDWCRKPKQSTEIDRVLFLRHYVIAFAHQKYLALVMYGNPDNWEFLNLHPIEIAPDESIVSHEFVEIMNVTLYFMTHPVMLDLTEKISRIVLGELTRVPLDLILRFDQLYNEWWQDMPEESRLCPGDPSKPDSLPYVAACTSQKQMIVYLLALAEKQEIYLRLSRPHRGTTMSFDGASELSRAIQDKYITSALDCLVNMLAVLRRLELTRKYCVFASEVFVGVADQLSVLASSENKVVANEAQKHLKSLLAELDEVWFMHGNKVSRDASPLLKMDMRRRNDPLYVYHNIMESYDVYPNPALAFCYDVLQTSRDDHVP
ncbi:hypothetical protein BC940DRAFT_287668 [Gongronella butleri]|nr:hypothetical protein BC940DRAFT_287668 [Gongronella butleri]